MKNTVMQVINNELKQTGHTADPNLHSKSISGDIKKSHENIIN